MGNAPVTQVIEEDYREKYRVLVRKDAIEEMRYSQRARFYLCGLVATVCKGGYNTARAAQQQRFGSAIALGSATMAVSLYFYMLAEVNSGVAMDMDINRPDPRFRRFETPMSRKSYLSYKTEIYAHKLVNRERVGPWGGL